MATPSQEYANFLAASFGGEFLALPVAAERQDLIGANSGQPIASAPATAIDAITPFDLEGNAATIGAGGALGFLSGLPAEDLSVFGASATFTVGFYLRVPVASSGTIANPVLSLATFDQQTSPTSQDAVFQVGVFRRAGFNNDNFLVVVRLLSAAGEVLEVQHQAIGLVNQNYLILVSVDFSTAFSGAPGAAPFTSRVFQSTDASSIQEAQIAAISSTFTAAPTEIDSGAASVSVGAADPADSARYLPIDVQGVFLSDRLLTDADIPGLFAFTPTASDAPEGGDTPIAGTPIPSFDATLRHSLPITAAYEFASDAVDQTDGAQQVVARWDRPRARYQFSFDLLSESDRVRGLRSTVADLEGLLDEVRGGELSFGFIDPFDFSASAIARTNSALGLTTQGIFYPAPDGTRTSFQAAKRYALTDNGGSATRPLTRIVGAASLPPGGTLDFNTGVLTFATAPPAGPELTADLHFEVPCRFEDDSAVIRLIAQMREADDPTSAAPSISIVEVKEIPLLEPVQTWSPNYGHEFALERQFGSRSRARQYDTTLTEAQSGFIATQAQRSAPVRTWELDQKDVLSRDRIDYLIALARLTRGAAAFKYVDYDDESYDVRLDGALQLSTRSAITRAETVGNSTVDRPDVLTCLGLTLREQPRVGDRPVLNDDGTAKPATIFTRSAVPIARAWVITRDDGVQIGGTDCDRAITVTAQGNPVFCDPRIGGSAQALERRIDGEVDETQQDFLLGRSSSVQLRDLLAGAFDGARVDVFAVDWAGNTALQIASQTLGQVTYTVGRDGGQRLQLETRSLFAEASQGDTQVTSKLCRLQFGDTGDNQCNADLTGNEDALTIAAIPTFDSIVVTGSEARTDTNFYGLFTFDANTATVALRGKRFGVYAFDPATEQLFLSPPLQVLPQAGDTGVGRIRCFKRFEEDCIDRFDNAENFGGEPNVFGEDFNQQARR